MKAVSVIRAGHVSFEDPEQITNIEQLFLMKHSLTLGNQTHESLVDPSQGFRQQTIIGNSKREVKGLTRRLRWIK